MFDTILQIACYAYGVLGFYLSYAVGKNEAHKTTLELYLLFTGFFVIFVYMTYFDVHPSPALFQ